MKKLMTGALTALLMASAAAPALAQQGGYPDGDPRNSGGRARYGAAVNRNPDQPRDQPPPQAAAPDQRRGERDWNRGDDGRRGGDERGRGDRGPGDRGPGDRGPGDRGSGDRGPGDRGDRNWDRGRGGDPGRVDGGRVDQGRDDRGRDWDRGRNWNNDRGRDGNRDQAWRDRGRDWDRDRPRYDRRYYPPVYRSQQRFRGPVWTPPIGFYSRSWAFGDTLPRGWYGQNYRMDWWFYGLPIPPVGYDWVRIRNDAVLIDEFTGRIVQVVPNLFW